MRAHGGWKTFFHYIPPFSLPLTHSRGLLNKSCRSIYLASRGGSRALRTGSARARLFCVRWNQATPSRTAERLVTRKNEMTAQGRLYPYEMGQAAQLITGDRTAQDLPERITYEHNTSKKFYTCSWKFQSIIFLNLKVPSKAEQIISLYEWGRMPVS